MTFQIYISWWYNNSVWRCGRRNSWNYQCRLSILIPEMSIKSEKSDRVQYIKLYQKTVWTQCLISFCFAVSEYRETLNKSHHTIVCTSCLHISRQPAQKILVMRQHYCGLFVQPDEKSDGAICTNDLISVSLKIKACPYKGRLFV